MEGGLRLEDVVEWDDAPADEPEETEEARSGGLC